MKILNGQDDLWVFEEDMLTKYLSSSSLWIGKGAKTEIIQVVVKKNQVKPVQLKQLS